MCPSPAPLARAASTNSRSRSEITCPRTSRAVLVQPNSAKTRDQHADPEAGRNRLPLAVEAQRDGRASSASAKIRNGMARVRSVIQLITASTQPPR